MPRDPNKLDVYRLAYDLALAVYEATDALPRSEVFGLKPQMRRSAVSIVANIAEGAARPSALEFARFLGIALGSAVELRCLIDLTNDLKMMPRDRLQSCRDCSDRVVRTLLKLQQTVRSFDS
jgi:four helix bundle protein